MIMFQDRASRARNSTCREDFCDDVNLVLQEQQVATTRTSRAYGCNSKVITDYGNDKPCI